LIKIAILRALIRLSLSLDLKEKGCPIFRQPLNGTAGRNLIKNPVTCFPSQQPMIYTLHGPIILFPVCYKY
jgi:hypothetical protein